MNEKLKKNLVIGIVGIGIIAAGGWGWNRYLRVSKVIRTNPVLSRDLELLKGETAATPVEGISVALHRLNSYRLPEGKKAAMKRIADPRPQVRGAVAEALAMHPLEGDVLEAESKLIHDSDESVRAAAIGAISHSNDPKRTQYLKEVLNDPKAGQREIWIAHAGLYLSTQGQEKADHLRILNEGLEKNQKDPALYGFLIRLLVRLSPSDGNAADAMEKAYLSPVSPKEMIPQIYRYLARNRPEFLKKRYLSDVRSTFLPLKMTALNSMMELCPADRWTAIQAVMGDSSADAQVKTVATRIAGYLGGSVSAKGVVQRASPAADRCEPKGSIAEKGMAKPALKSPLESTAKASSMTGSHAPVKTHAKAKRK
jgi:hypothetical protein